MISKYISEIYNMIDRFLIWFDGYGEISYDHQSYFAGLWGGKAKSLYYKRPLLGTFIVAPMIFSEAFVPSARRLFWQKQRFPIADAHYAMGFAYLSEVLNNKAYYDRAIHFLKILEQTRCSNYEQYCWGYPFDWETRNGTIKKGTPLITTTPYVYEAFSIIYAIDKSERWLNIMRLIADHALQDIRDFQTSPDASTCSYTPFDGGGVINASAYRAFLLTAAAKQFSDDRYWNAAERNLNFVLQSQQHNGSWLYSIDSVRDFIDHFHTCFVLKALVKIENMTGHEGCTKAIERGIQYYIRNLFDEQKLPKPFSKPPRLTVYKQELYDYAECINLAVLVKGRFSEFDDILVYVVMDLLQRWQKNDGSFRSRKLYTGWDNVPMHRWAQSQIFRSLSFLLLDEIRRRETGVVRENEQVGCQIQLKR